MDATQTSVLIGAAGATTGTLLGIVCTKGVDAWLKLRKDTRDEKTTDAAAEDNTLRFIIGRQDARIERLETELKDVHTQHADCEKKHESLKVRLEVLGQRVDTFAKEDDDSKVRAIKRVLEHDVKHPKKGEE